MPAKTSHYFTITQKINFSFFDKFSKHKILESKRIEFTSQKELVTQLKRIEKKALHAKNRYWFNYPISFEIAPSSKQKALLPEYVASTIQQRVLSNPLYTKLEIHSPLFTLAQREEIELIPIKRVKEQARRRSRLYSFLFLGTINGFFATLGLGLALPLIALRMLTQSVMSGLANVIRQKYLDFAASYYTANQPRIKNRTEKWAFEYGIQSQSTWGWLKSFFSLSTYIHPFAFAAGLEHALEKNNDIIAKALGKPLNHQKRFAIRVKLKQKDTHKNVQLNWIHFNNQQELDLALNQIMQAYGENYIFENSPAKLSLGKEKNSSLPSYVRDSIQKAILDNRMIQAVSSNKHKNRALFSNATQKMLANDCQHNKKENKRRKANFNSKFSLSILASIFFNPLLSFGVIAGIFGFGKQAYLDRVLQSYNTGQKIARITNKNERKALLYGIKAGRSNKELLFSWGRKETYTHFNAFEAGKEIALENNHALLKAIKSFKH